MAEGEGIHISNSIFNKEIKYKATGDVQILWNKWQYEMDDEIKKLCDIWITQMAK